ncbi:MAG TPA: hypothetical protein VGH19_22435 [Verrucomicrobiae bacterium]
MAEREQKRFWRNCRVCFRWCRVALLLLVLFVVCLLIYVTRIGVPESVKRPLLSELRQRGIDLQFQRMRWTWFRGIVAEGVTIGETNQTGGLQFKARELVVQLDDEKLKSFKFIPRVLVLNEGKMDLALNETNQPARLLSVDKVSTEIHLLPNDQWELMHFKANTLGVNLNLSGSITNASKLRELTRKEKKPGGGDEDAKKPKEKDAWKRQLRVVTDTMERMQFEHTPELYLVVRGDASDAASFFAEANLEAKSAMTPWGSWENLKLSAPLNAKEMSNGLFQAEMTLRFDQGHTPWGVVKQAKVNVRLEHSITNPAPFRADWDVSLNGLQLPYGQLVAQQLNLSGVTRRETNAPSELETKFKLRSQAVKSEWAQAAGAQLDAHVISSLTNPIPNIRSLELTLDQPRSEWAQARKLKLSGEFSLTNAPVRTNESWGFWAKLAPYAIQWKIQSENLRVWQLRFPTLATAGRWTAPKLEVTSLESALAGGEADIAAQLDVTDRRVWTKLRTDVDIQRLAHLMSTNAQQWLGDIKWDKAPELNLEGRMELPPWTGKATNWNEILLNRTWVSGGLSVGPVAYQELSVKSLEADFGFTNGFLAVTNLHLIRPEGELRVTGQADFTKQEFKADVASSINPLIVKPLVKKPKTQKVFNDFILTTPPHLRAQVSAVWTDWETLQAGGQLNFTNFSYQGHGISNLSTHIGFTNQFLSFSKIDLRRNAEENAIADGVGLDLIKGLVHITNGLVYWDVGDATGIIGPKTKEAVDPYQFATPPLVHVEGMIPLRDAESSDLHFKLFKGGPFNYWRFNLPEVRADLHWVTNTLVITNLAGQFYGGAVRGDAFFDFGGTNGTDYRFHAIITNSNLKPFLTDMLQRSNTHEGVIDCDLTITSAQAKDMKTWNGFGTASMRDGFLWDIPLFGAMTPLLEGVNEGLGKSRVREGSASYFITNSVIYTQDLELKTPTIRMAYKGSIDFDANVDAKVEGALFRDSPLVIKVFGYLTTPFTKLYEYKVTGTLSEPKLDTVHFVPKVVKGLLFPLRIFKIFSGGDRKKNDEPKPAVTPESAPPAPSTPEKKQ